MTLLPMRRLVALALLVLVALPASASLVEDTLAPAGVTYQEDGGKHGDAPATCALLDTGRTVGLDADRSYGMLVEIDDEADAFAFELTQASVGDRVGVQLLPGIAVDRYDIAFDVRSPDCASSVFDPSSAYYNPPPQQPYQPPLGRGVFAARVTGYACDPGAWKFLANQMGGIPAPADIYVEWTDGSWEYVPMQKSTPATIAMYRTTSHLDVTVARALIVLPATWRGEFHIASGPCDAAVGEPPQPPEASARYGEFTVQEAGTHVVVVTIARGTVDKTLDTVQDPPTAINAGCHYTTCLVAFEGTSFGLDAATLTA